MPSKRLQSLSSMNIHRAIFVFAMAVWLDGFADEQLPVIDVHVHASDINDNGPPPVPFCFSSNALFPAWDPAGPPWPAILGSGMNKAPCKEPVWSPVTLDELRDRTLAEIQAHNVTAVLSGPRDRVAEWQKLLPERVLPAWKFSLVNNQGLTPQSISEAYTAGNMLVFGEITNQYHGVLPDDPRMEPFWAAAEENDIPVALHIGPGPPGAHYLGHSEFRASGHSPLTLEPVLRAHPKLRIYVMHAGWPHADEMIALMWNHPQVYVDTGILIFGIPREAFYYHLKRLVDAGFSNRILFGSDGMTWPEAIGHGIKMIEEAPFLTETQKRDILYNNAKRFLRLPD